ncbi:MAG: DNA primase [Candidatus Paceibacterota bacterium]|jgi:DNA primase
MLSPVDQIKERLSISDVVSSYIKIDRAGANYKARCPFHNEKTPSFVVSPGRGNYHCFGCNRGGDIFSFVEEIEGIDFTQALKMLAERAGVTLEKVDYGAHKEKVHLYGLLDEATKFFEVNLYKNEAVKDYLKKRGLKEETVRKFRIGFAPAEWNSLQSHLLKKGYTDREMEQVGIIIQGNRGYYDRFRSRIMFPIADSQGRIVGYSGRIFSIGTTEEKDVAKYVNSPETALYSKSNILFGYDKAKQTMMQKNSCLIVEGQMDLLMSHQAGTTNTVATSGTALTVEQLNLIKRFTDTLLLSFDADEAGFKASERGVRLALSLGMDVKIISLPDGIDPADFILKDETGWHIALTKSKHIIDFCLKLLREKNPDDREFRKEVEKKIFPYVADIVSPIDQAHFIKKVSERIGLQEDVIRESLSKIKSQDQSNYQLEKHEATPLISPKYSINHRLLGIIIWQDGEKESVISLKMIKEEYTRVMEVSADEAITRLSDSEKNNLALQAEMYYSPETVGRAADELLKNLEQEVLQEELTITNVLIKKSELDGKPADDEILKKHRELSQKIDILKTSRFSG